MTDLEKLIEGLEMSYRYSNVDEDNTLVPQQLVLDVLALLKAQEPRVLELDEFENVLGRDVPLYFEQRDSISGWDIYSGLEKETMDIITSAVWAEDQTWQREFYGKEWRCWTSRPTEEQSKAVKWE